jgi:uncharacterized membrane protein
MFDWKKEILYPLLKSIPLLFLPSLFSIIGYLKEEAIFEMIGLSLGFIAYLFAMLSLLKKITNSYTLLSEECRFSEIITLTLFAYAVMILSSCGSLAHNVKKLPVFWVGIAMLGLTLFAVLFLGSLEIHYARRRQKWQSRK